MKIGAAGISLETFSQGVTDEWVFDITAKGWLIITGDPGRSDRRSERSLPLICIKNRIVHFRLSGTLQNLPCDEKARAIIATWQDIVAAHESGTGCRWTIRRHDKIAGFQLVSLDK